MKNVKKLNVSKNNSCCLDDMPKTRSLSETKQKQDETSPLLRNSNTLPKKKDTVTSQDFLVIRSINKCKRNISVDEFSVKSSHIKSSEDKENVMPSVKCVQTRSTTKNNVLVQQNSACYNENDKLNVPCYDKASSAHDSGKKVSKEAGITSRKLIFHENSFTKQEDVYDFDEGESSTNPTHIKRKRKKVLNSSDEEYVPPKSRRNCKPRQLNNARLRQNIHNCDSKCKMEDSQFTQLLPKMNDERMLQASSNVDDDSLAWNSLQASNGEQHNTLQPVTDESKVIFASCNLSGLSPKINFSHTETTCNTSGVKPVVGLARQSSVSVCSDAFVASKEITPAKHCAALVTSSTENVPTFVCPSTTKALSKSGKLRRPKMCTTPRDYVEGNCSLGDLFTAPFISRTEDVLTDPWCAEDPSGAFKGFTYSKCVCTVDSKFCHCSAAHSLELFSLKDDKKRASENNSVGVNRNVLRVTSVRNVNACDELALSEKTNIGSIVNSGFARNFSMASDLQTSENSCVKDVGRSSEVSFTLGDISADRKLLLKPVVYLKRLTLPFSTCGSDGVPGEGTPHEHVCELDTSNKENIPTNCSSSKTPGQSRRSWRPTAYVSPKPYVERYSSFEDTFDSPCGTVTENDVMNLGKSVEKPECIGTHARELCATCTSVCSRDCTHSSGRSELVVESYKFSPCQEIDGNIGVVSTHSVHVTNCDSPSVRTVEDPRTKVDSAGNDVAHIVVSEELSCTNGRKDSVGDDIEACDSISHSAVMEAEICKEVVHSSVGNSCVSSGKGISFMKGEPRIEVRRNSGVVCHDVMNVEAAGECNADNYFGFDQEEPEEELLSPIRLQPFAPKSQPTITTSSTPDHGTSTAHQGRKPWRPALSGVTVKPFRQVQMKMHSFLSKSAPQFRQEVSTVLVPEPAASSISVHQSVDCPREVAAAVSTPAIFSADHKLSGPLEQDSNFSKQPSRRVYSHPRKVRTHQLDSFLEEPPVEDKGENVSRKVAKKRSRKQNEAAKDMKNLLSAINNEFETIENFELCVE